MGAVLASFRRKCSKPEATVLTENQLSMYEVSAMLHTIRNCHYCLLLHASNIAPPQYFAKGAMHQSGPSNN